MDFIGSLWIWEVLRRGCLAACAGLCRRTGSPNIKISDSGGSGLEPWCLDAWMLAGLEWIGGGDGAIGLDARWEDGIGRTSHTLKLQELGGFVDAEGPCRCLVHCYFPFTWRLVRRLGLLSFGPKGTPQTFTGIPIFCKHFYVSVHEGMYWDMGASAVICKDLWPYDAIATICWPVPAYATGITC